MTIVVNAQDNAAFNYASGSFCLSDPDPTPTITGTGGGKFTIDNSGSINASTGQIDIAASGIGSYVITYTTTGSCPDTSTFNIIITNSTDATITQVGPFCDNEPGLNLSAVSPGGAWAGTGITDTINGTFDPATAGVGSHVIVYTISGSCGDVDTMTIVVNAQDNAAFNYTSGSYCLSDPDPTPTVTGTPGGTFTIDNSGSVNASTGQIDLNTSGIGSYVITYTTIGSCPDTSNISITICPAPVGILEKELNSTISIYPNPANNEMVYVDFGNVIYDEVQLTVYNILGETVQQGEMIGKGKQMIDLSGLAKGVYLLYFRSENFSVAKKLQLN